MPIEIKKIQSIGFIEILHIVEIKNLFGFWMNRGFNFINLRSTFYFHSTTNWERSKF